jgi:molybdopterin-biosynthesis enzyme MoeA-like protein
LVKFDLHKPSPEILSQPVVLRLKYIDAETDKQVTVEKNAALIWNDYTGIPELVVEQEQKKLYAIATMNQTLKVMAQAVEAKNNTKARQVLVSTYTQMRNLFPKATDEDVRKLMESIDRYIHAFDMQQQNETLKKKQ